MSESVFVGLCRTVGSSSIVAIRRDMMDIAEKFYDQTEMNEIYVCIDSGSYREGFRLEGSDRDIIAWSKQQSVIWDLSQAQYCQSIKSTHIFADCSESSPGFALLQLLTPTTDETVRRSCFRMNGKLYISSSVHRQTKCSAVGIESKIHGPCVSGHCGQVEYDAAHGFVSDIWPPPASSWIERCQIWPSYHIVNEIIEGGCHFVAIGNKMGNHEDSEWRISFSLAEQKLVYSMNHYHFLIYGLLKIFLKEVINNTPDEDNLLCSYHMKTAVFWAIQSDTLTSLCPQNILEGFWVCFKLILKWVYKGYCPNFFIPENNMYLAKIFGTTQKNLFSRLYGLYGEGLSCLLKSSTIKSYIVKFPYDPNCSIDTDENTLFSAEDFDLEVYDNIWTVQNKQLYLRIPSLVLFHMLEFLCYRHTDILSSQKALEDLHVLVHQGQMIHEESRDISWQILGICQQISENYQAALYAYLQSLTVDPCNSIQTATLVRILIAIAASQ
ncbi:uncharacterized protein LOC133193920 [Saccostrea echinata]|uniref:uncharacterized protein LOC133193920 n=1 Tax=Saccostrea echinata TaxID=191078 RepID=UPI002A82151E|nr:uncharacterized protein LOC133193920 [Saccostrea echinata]